MKIALLEPLRVPDSLIEELAAPLEEAGHEFVYYPEKTTDPEELYQRSQDAEIVIIANNPYPAEVIERLEQTKLINVAFTGVDHVDQAAAKAKGIQIANASGYSAHAVPELVIGLTLALYRQIIAGDQDTRLGSQFEAPIQGQEIHGKKVGIIGTGSLGIEAARLYKAFGAELIGYNRSQKEAALDLGLEYKSLEEVMAESDIISIHLPQTEETKGLISKEQIARMKETAILINVARGPIVDNEALAEALNAGAIAGAGIDVYDSEPPLADDYPLLHSKNTVLTPHVGYLTDEAMVDRARIAFDNALKFSQGNPQNIVNN
ncbi:hydroxyacid dehydrogenase [Suicoccus acidiformans]|uniref:Hydroxyacid dehydrogenase n=1 Tax=Suicoccus acidiformans TaxID=2036206 RepID=A0A347WID0_9LACT|nr:2-hydroxyacid dehydrogenase [Suicoccus acidiformans]AXY24837.1 hydroxyacid dehydrogenase [Suicoccus acidiformans]